MSTISRPDFATQTVTIIILAAHDATVARANLDGITAAGSAKLEPGDHRNNSIGEDLAVARALAILSRKLERRARGAVRHAESVKAARAARRRKDAGEMLASLTGETGGTSGYSIHGRDNLRTHKGGN
jgi:uncharacterized protein DUF1876